MGREELVTHFLLSFFIGRERLLRRFCTKTKLRLIYSLILAINPAGIMARFSCAPAPISTSNQFPILISTQFFALTPSRDQRLQRCNAHLGLEELVTYLLLLFSSGRERAIRCFYTEIKLHLVLSLALVLNPAENAKRSSCATAPAQISNQFPV